MCTEYENDGMTKMEVSETPWLDEDGGKPTSRPGSSAMMEEIPWLDEDGDKPTSRPGSSAMMEEIPWLDEDGGKPTSRPGSSAMMEGIPWLDEDGGKPTSRPGIPVMAPVFSLSGPAACFEAIQLLPVEMWAYILSFIDPYTTPGLALVCKLFHSLYDVKDWKCLTLTNSFPPIHTLNKLTSLEILNVKTFGADWKLDLIVPSCGKTLRYLHGDMFPLLFIPRYPRRMDLMTKLQVLEISCCCTYDMIFPPTLKRLYLDCITDIVPWKSLDKLKSLTHFQVYHHETPVKNRNESDRNLFFDNRKVSTFKYFVFRNRHFCVMSMKASNWKLVQFGLCELFCLSFEVLEDGVIQYNIPTYNSPLQFYDKYCPAPPLAPKFCC